MELVNRTSLVVDRSAFFDARGAEHLVFAAKAAFVVGPSGVLSPAPTPPVISTTDTFLGEPAHTSLTGEAELGPPKPRTDCVLRGRAVPSSRSTTRTRVSFSVGSMAQHAVVLGPRRWIRRTSPEPSEPQPIGEPVPLVWERAFGGVDATPDDARAHVWQRDNPVGRGLLAEGTKKDLDAEELPQLEDPSAPIESPRSRPRPVGFGFVARHWEPRLAFGGTYDTRWRRERMPLVPEDFDPRFHQAAAPALSRERLRGGERLVAEGVSSVGRIALALPRAEMEVLVRTRTANHIVQLALDTVMLDTEPTDGAGPLLTLLYKGALAVHGFHDDIRETRFTGAVSP